MPRLPRLSGNELIRVLSKVGFQPVRQKGSHVILTRMTSEGKRAVVVPLHRELDLGTLLEILRQARLKRDDFFKLL